MKNEKLITSLGFLKFLKNFNHHDVSQDALLILDELKEHPEQIENLEKYLKTHNPDEYINHEICFIHFAAHYGFFSILKVLEKNGADLNKTCSIGNTALHYAAKANQRSVIEWLLQRNADTNVLNFEGISPALYCIRNNDRSSLKRMIQFGLNVDAPLCSTPIQTTHIQFAIREGKKEIVELLLNEGANINQAKKDGWSLAHTAVMNNHPSILKILMSRNIDLNQRNSDLKSPLDLAIQENHRECIDILLYFNKEEFSELFEYTLLNLSENSIFKKDLNRI